MNLLPKVHGIVEAETTRWRAWCGQGTRWFDSAGWQDWIGGGLKNDVYFPYALGLSEHKQGVRDGNSGIPIGIINKEASAFFLGQAI